MQKIHDTVTVGRVVRWRKVVEGFDKTIVGLAVRHDIGVIIKLPEGSAHVCLAIRISRWIDHFALLEIIPRIHFPKSSVPTGGARRAGSDAGDGRFGSGGFQTSRIVNASG